MRVALAQINPSLGDFESNYQKILSNYIKAEQNGADIVILPELAISGYNPQDLVLRKAFLKESMLWLNKLINETSNHNAAIIVGAVHSDSNKTYNSAFFIHKGKILHIHNKMALPNYGVFDEKRLFTKGTKFNTISFKNHTIGLLVCEDIWTQVLPETKYDIIIVINASPFELGKHKKRLGVIQAQAKTHNTQIIYLNMVGAQDSIIYDGGSIIVSKDGELLYQSDFFKESFEILDINQIIPIPEHYQDDIESIYHGLILSLRDYLHKNNKTDVVLGFSGGIDSALTAVLAIDAIGKERVHLVTMPSRYTSTQTYNDAALFLKNLNIKTIDISIEPTLEALLESTNVTGIAEQNLQSRIRGTILMALSNEYGYMLLSTGNKSELAVGYATLYGDMNGGYNLLKDLYKTDVYNLANYRNKISPVIPQVIITKEPTAELKYNQKDSDSLPDYGVLDQILMQYIEQSMSCEEIVKHCKLGHKVVNDVIQLVKNAEFKRNQSTLGPKIRNMSFDLDWRMPITNKFIG